MIWMASFAVGAGIGLVCLGGLWLSVRGLSTSSQPRPLRLTASRLLRLALAGAAFVALSHFGPRAVLWGLAGLWLARSCVVWQLVREVPHAR